MLVITGMHRSGTSMTAQMLQAAGLFIGERLMWSHPSNPAGHFEDLDFYELSCAILADNGLAESGLVSDVLVTVSADRRRQAEELIASRRALGIPWGWKDPRTVLLLDLWLELLPEAHVLFTFRPPWEVMDSLYRRGDASCQDDPLLALRTWSHYNTLIRDLIRANPRRSSIFEVGQVAGAPGEFIGTLAARTGIPLSYGESTFQAELMLRRADERQISVVHALSPAATRLYSELCALARQDVAPRPLPATHAPAPDLECALAQWARTSAPASGSRALSSEPVRPGLEHAPTSVPRFATLADRSREGAGRRVLRIVHRGPNAMRIAVQQHGGLAGALRAAIAKLKAQGPAALLRSAKLRFRMAGMPLAAEPRVAANPYGPDGSCESGVARPGPIPASCRVLFIGCDGHVAGSQVLLLNQLKWLRTHTSIDVRTILIRDGELAAEYARCGPVLVWSEFAAAVRNPRARQARLMELYGDCDLVYGNTVVAASIYRELECLGVPVITHVHELEKSIRSLCSAQQIEDMLRMTSRFIACSGPVAGNLVGQHGVDPECVSTINAFIERRDGSAGLGRAGARRRLGIREGAFVVVGCGTMYARKGVDLFVETAIRLRDMGLDDIEFVWIGPQHWDLDPQSAELMPWRAVERRIDDSGIRGSIRFTGQLENPREHFEAADVFFLPSREDPFPLVCLEAAQVGTPIVCFEGCGGMPGFVDDDAGIVVPSLDVRAAADAIATLRREPLHRARLGRKAAEKIAHLHTDDIAVPQVLREIHSVAGTSPLVSVIVPSFNHAPFLERRIESILGQGFRDVELVILDDASTDGSLQIARRYAHLPNVRIVENKRNSGSAFRQWAKGLQLAQGELAWIAESDDASAPGFLEELLGNFADPEVALAYSDSRVINERDEQVEPYTAYYGKLDRSHWKMDYVLPSWAEVNYGLGVKNTMPSVSAVVFRRSLATQEVLSAIVRMQFAGDWMFHLHIARGQKVAFRCLPLNMHRKHASTLTHRFNSDPSRAQRLLDETLSVHKWVLDHCPVTDTYTRRLAAYLDEQVDALFPGAAALGDDRHYPRTKMLQQARAAAEATARTVSRIAFVTTNDSSHDGGSEQLWIHAAQRMAESGCRVMVVIRRWDPEPYFIADFRRLGIEIAYKDRDPAAAVAQLAPELVVVNIGDQDEGVEWFEACRTLGLQYCILNHLTKEPRYWPVRSEVLDSVRQGNLGAARVLFTSRNNRSLMERRLGCRIPSAELFHNPLYVDRTRSLPFPSLTGPIRLAMPARMLNIHKGQAVAIDVFGMRKWRERPIELHLYGHGPDERTFRDKVARLGLDGVRFHDPRWQLPHPDMESIWRDCHGLLMTSFMEGMPLVLLNAMFYGRVPIVTDIGGHREVVEDGISGFVATNPTPESVDEALERAWARVGEWRSIGAKARESMLGFSPEDPVGDLIEKLRLIIKAGGA